MKRESMTTMDNFWLRLDEPTNLMVITAVFEFDHQLDYDRLKETIKKRWLIFDRFEKKITYPSMGFGLPKWEKDQNFDIRSHVQRIALSGSGDKEALQEIISDLSAAPLDPEKPLWQVHLIDNYNGGSVLFWRIHHCIADGVSLVNAILSICDREADSDYVQKKLENVSIKKQSKEMNKTLISFSRKMINFFASPEKLKKSIKTLDKKNVKNFQKKSKLLSYYDGIKNFSNNIYDLCEIIHKQTFMRQDPESIFKGKLSVRKNVAWTETIPVSMVKNIGKKHNATINDVLVSAITGVLRKHMIKNNNSVNDLSLHVSMPINRRKPGTECELGNKFALVSLALPIHIEDPILRLYEVKKRNDKIKASPEAAINYHALKIIGTCPSDLTKKLIYFVANKGSAVMSNVPGPGKSLYLAGKKIKNMMFWVPRTGNVGMGISFISYAGNITVGLACDEKLVLNPQTILDNFKIELDMISNHPHSIVDIKQNNIINFPSQQKISNISKKEMNKKNDYLSGIKDEIRLKQAA